MNFCIVSTFILNFIAITIAIKDYYQILEIDKSATSKEIKKAFRNMAVKYHPDKNPDADPNIFMEIKEAYDVLYDEKERRRYDQLGHSLYSQQKSGGGGGGGHHQFHQHFNFDSFDDLFKDFDEDFGFLNTHFGADHHSGFNSFDGDFINLDEMFGDHYGGSHFGSQDTFFGNAHFQHSEHMKRHQDTHNRAHRQANFAQGHHHAHQRTVNVNQGSSRSCKTVTQRVGNMVTTYTTCS